MAFRFPLQSVLHLREGLEHQQELRLRAANQKVARVRHQIGHVEQQLHGITSTQAKELGAGTTAAELMFAAQCEAQLHRQLRELERQLAVAQKASDQQREIFQRAKREREKLESVREQQARAYRTEAARREQRNLDDLFLMLMRREYSRH
jgi:flagellar export protein FliJ